MAELPRGKGAAILALVANNTIIKIEAGKNQNLNVSVADLIQ
jgi:hypothetical protein